MIVVDTNVLIYFYVEGEFTEFATDVFVADPTWEAPFLWRSEFRNTMLLYLRKGLLKATEIKTFAQLAEELMFGHEHFVSSSQVINLTPSSSCSAYDCEFLTLAQDLGVPLVTEDKRMLKEFPNIAVTMEQFVNL